MEENAVEMVSFVNKNENENDNTPATNLKTSTVSGWTQLKALLYKNYIIQIHRNTSSTIIDILIVPILIAFLVVIYNQTSIMTFNERSYSDVNITFPSNVFMENFVPFYHGGDMNKAVRRLIVNDAYDMHYQKMNETSHRKLEEAQGLSYSGNGGVPSEIPFKKNPHKKNDVMMQLYILHQSIQGILSGPLPIPTIDQYIYMSDIINSIVKPEDMDAMLQNSDFFRIWGNMITLGTIHLSPRNHTLMGDLLEYWRKEHRITRNLVKIRVHESPTKAMEYIYDHLDERTWAFIHINSDSEDVEFVIRMNYTTIPNTARISNEISVGLNTEYQQYYLSGFLTIQQTLDDFIMYQSSQKGYNCTARPKRISMPLPTTSYAQNPFYFIAGMFFSLYIILIFLYPSSKCIKHLVEEKESRMKQTLFILGIKPWSYYLSWCITSFVTFLIISLIVTGLLATTIFNHTSTSLLFLYILSFSSSIISFSFFISSFFSNANLASLAGPISLFITMLPKSIFRDTNVYESSFEKYLVSLLPCTSFALGLDIMIEYEYNNMGLNWSNAYVGNYTFISSLLMLILDTILYIGLALYLDCVLPSQYGTPKPWYFIFLPSFWRSSTNKKYSPLASYEEGNAAVTITNLVKRYPNATVNSVNNLNLSLYPNEITCLLGHNGAGKTSTISILTGLYTPTSGNVIIHGKSIHDDLDGIRQSMGICPQYDVLFGDLSVYEHLYFIQWIKGIQVQDSTIYDLAKQVGLQNKLHALAKTLTGGMKRKLSVAIAFSGNPKFVLLDEPTSGMDPLSRRVIWDLLAVKKNEVKDRVIVLTTHYMEEAEILADTIAIMKLGKLQSCGNLLTLKRKFGLGYKLRALLSHSHHKQIITDVQQPNAESALDYEQLSSFHVHQDDIVSSKKSIKEIELSTMKIGQSKTEAKSVLSSTSGYQPLKNDFIDEESNMITNTTKSTPNNIQSILQFLQNYIPKTQYIRQSGRELTFRFPMQCEEKFPALFDALTSNSDKIKDAYGIVSYGITNTTLDDVFLQLADDEDNEKQQNDTNIQDVITNTSKYIQHETSFLQQTWILFLKRCTVQKRDKKGTFFLIVLPAIMITLAFAVLVVENNPVGPSLVFDMDLLGHTTSSSMEFDKDKTPETSNGWENNITKQVLFAYNDNNHDHGDFGDKDLEQVKDIMNVFTASNIKEEVNNLNNDETSKKKHNTKIEYDILQNSINSTQFSKDILSNYNNKYYTPYYGAYILKDIMNIKVDIHWNNVYKLFQSFYQYEKEKRRHHHHNHTNHTEYDSTYEEQVDRSYGSISRRAIIDKHYFDNTPNVQQLYDEDTNINEVIDQLTNTSNDIATWQVLRDILLEHMDDDLNPFGNDTSFSDVFADVPMTTESHPYYPVDVSVLHNSSTPHAIAILNHAYSTYLHQKCTAESSSSVKSSPPKVASIVNHPLPLTSQQRIEERVILSGIVVFFLLVPLCYIPGAFIVFTVRENTCKAKHVQLVSGVDMLAYWVSNYCFDLLLYLFISLSTSMILLAYGRDVAVTFIGDFSTGLCSFLLIFGYGVSAIPFAYIISRQFKNSTSAQIVVISISFLTGLISTLLYYILKGLHMKHMYRGLMKVCRIFPSFNVGVGLFDMATTYWYRVFLHKDATPFDSKICWDSVVYLYGLAIPYFFILLLLEYSSDGGSGGSAGQTLRWFRESFDQLRLKRLGTSFFSRSNAVVNDVDVEKERNFVSKHRDDLRHSASILLTNLWKVYPLRKQADSSNIFISLLYNAGQLVNEVVSLIQSALFSSNDTQHIDTLPTITDHTGNMHSHHEDVKVAIRGLHMAIPQGETFGLLGVNGAGKTSTLSILTGDLKPTHGDVYVAGHDMSGKSIDGVTKARKCIGYCPQSDPLLEWMTARETLIMFGKLRGISSDYLVSFYR